MPVSELHIRFNLRGGHAGGHLRDGFWEAIEALAEWDGNGEMPRVLVGGCPLAGRQVHLRLMEL